MKACFDVQYSDTKACVAAVIFENWTDEQPTDIIIHHVEEIAGYESGSFYKRELPCLLAILPKIHFELDCLVIDGNVFLEGEKPGLGVYLYEAIGQQIPVIGVAKNKFKSIGFFEEVFRGDSLKPLIVTAVGMELDSAVAHIQSMYGPYRIPTLLKWVDRAARDGLS